MGDHAKPSIIFVMSCSIGKCFSSGSCTSRGHKQYYYERFMGIRFYKSYTPGTRNRSVSEFVEITFDQVGKKVDLASPKIFGTEQQRCYHHQAPWRWAQAVVPHHRLL